MECKDCETVREKGQAVWCSKECEELWQGEMNDRLIPLRESVEVLNKMRDELFGSSWRDL